MAERRWRVRLGAAAELDFANIVKWTTENFGARQSRVYQKPLVQAIGELAEGPDVPGGPKNNDRNRTNPARRNGPSASPSICPRRECRIERGAGWLQATLAQFWIYKRDWP